MENKYLWLWIIWTRPALFDLTENVIEFNYWIINVHYHSFSIFIRRLIWLKDNNTLLYLIICTNPG